MRKMALMVAVAGFSVWASAAAASDITFEGVGKVGIVTVSLTGSPIVGTPLTVDAGEILWSEGGASSSFYAYCVDLNHYVQNVQVVNPQSTSAMSGGELVPDAGNRAGWLLNTYGATIHADGTGTDAAALQVAIWASIYNVVPSLSGAFTLSNPASTIGTEATTYLNALATQGSSSSATWLAASNGQSQITASDAVSPTPEPAAMVLGGTGLLGLLLFRRRAIAI
jgi:hypothetical protein